MNKQRKVVITVTYNEMGIIIDTKAEEVAQKVRTQMSRLIDADALKRRAQEVATEAWKMKLTAKIETTLNQFIDWINDAPTIEPERKKGHYIGEYDGYADGNPVVDTWYCSECDCCFEDWDEKPTYNFCPNCGADMRGEQG